MYELPVIRGDDLHDEVASLACQSTLTSLTFSEWCYEGEYPLPLPEVVRFKVDKQDVSLRSLLPLTNLTALNLACTTLKDKELPLLSNLSQLTALNLEDSDLTISKFPFLPQLKWLNVSANHVLRLEGIWDCTSLVSLSLVDISIQDIPFERLPLLPSLTFLDITACSLNTEGIKALTAYTTLTELNAGGCNLDTEAHRLLTLPHLTSLNIEETEVDDAMIAAIIANTTLEVLSLNSSVTPERVHLLNQRRTPFSRLEIICVNVGVQLPTNAETLILVECSVTDEALDSLAGNTTLTELLMYGNHLTSACFPLLISLPNLLRLELRIADRESCDLLPLTTSTSLTHLDIDGYTTSEVSHSTLPIEIRDTLQRNILTAFLPLSFLLPALLRLRYNV